MERRKAPTSFARQAIIVFEVTGAIGTGVSIGLAALIYCFWPNPPIWAFSVALGVGFILFVALFLWKSPKFKCPQCGKVLRRDTKRGTEEGQPIHFVCTDCQIEWDSRMHTPS